VPKGIYKRIKPSWNKGKKEFRADVLTKLRESHKGKKVSETTKTKMGLAHKGLNTWTKGTKMSKETKDKIRVKMSGDKCHKWKGDSAGYRSFHHWMNNHYGKPTTCEHCQTGNLTGHRIHWATKTKELKRERENWLRLCVKCHKLFDKIK
jgi:hypothetical protein